MKKDKLFHVGLPTLPSKGSLELMTAGANRLLFGGYSPQVFPKTDRITPVCRSPQSPKADCITPVYLLTSSYFFLHTLEEGK